MIHGRIQAKPFAKLVTWVCPRCISSTTEMRTEWCFLFLRQIISWQKSRLNLTAEIGQANLITKRDLKCFLVSWTHTHTASNALQSKADGYQEYMSEHPILTADNKYVDFSESLTDEPAELIYRYCFLPSFNVSSPLFHNITTCWQATIYFML